MAENLPDTNVGNIDYISRQAAIEAVRQAVIKGYDTDYGVIDSDVVYEVIDDIPAADLVPVVRCRDCKYYEGRHWCGLNKTNFDPDEFCSYGERREE